MPIDACVRRGDWNEPESFEINRKTLGLVGFGNIGAQVARRAHGFEMRVLAYDTQPNRELAAQCGVEFSTGLDGLLAQSDFVSLHVPRLPETYHLIGKRELALMKPGAVLVNTARGGIVDEEALAEVLANGHLLGAGLDVFETEPLSPNSPLLALPNVILSPHCAADTRESAHNVGMAAARNLLDAMEKLPRA